MTSQTTRGNYEMGKLPLIKRLLWSSIDKIKHTSVKYAPSETLLHNKIYYDDWREIIRKLEALEKEIDQL